MNEMRSMPYPCLSGHGIDADVRLRSAPSAANHP
jgi:hypothetical protein